MKKLKLTKIQAASEAISKAERKLTAIVYRQFPVHEEIRWRRGFDLPVCHGEVVMHGSSGNLRVQNYATGVEYWIEPYKIVEDTDD